MRSPTVNGVILALAAAMCFGVTTPALQYVSSTLGPFTISALLCAGAATASLAATTFGTKDPPLLLHHGPRLVLVAILGSAIAPALLAFGLSRANGIAACLLLNLEAVFTAFIGILLYRESIGWRFVIGITAITTAAFLLVSDTAANDADEVLGLMAVAFATLGWSVDNALSRPLSKLDPSEVVFAKGTVGAIVAAGLALGTEPLPSSRTALIAVFLCGFVGYGGTERFYLLSQRSLGVARTSSLFAVSPFFGAALALALGGATGSMWMVAGVVMAIGVYLHATEDHVEAPPVRQPQVKPSVVPTTSWTVPPQVRSSRPG